jgi:deoxyribonuclease V
LRIRFSKQITPKDAIRLQRKLSPLVKEASELPTPIHNLVGCDATYFSGITVAAATQVSYMDRSLLKIRSTMENTRFPYIPGLLAFREAPVVLRAIRGLHAKDYVCLVDAHGIAHPRRFGLACYVGLALDRPTIGVAKSPLYGQVKGSRLVDGEDGRILAELVKTPGGKTIYVSVGHKISLEDAVLVVKQCMGPGGPVPIRLAHDEVTKRKWRIKNSNQVS